MSGIEYWWLAAFLRPEALILYFSLITSIIISKILKKKLGDKINISNKLPKRAQSIIFYIITILLFTFIIYSVLAPVWDEYDNPTRNCHKVEDKYKKADCLEKESVSKKDFSLCDSSYFKSICYRKYIEKIDNLSIEDLTICNMIDFPTEKWICYGYLGARIKNVSICDMIQVENKRVENAKTFCYKQANSE